MVRSPRFGSEEKNSSHVFTAPFPGGLDCGGAPPAGPECPSGGIILRRGAPQRGAGASGRRSPSPEGEALPSFRSSTRWPIMPKVRDLPPPEAKTVDWDPFQHLFTPWFTHGCLSPFSHDTLFTMGTPFALRLLGGNPSLNSGALRTKNSFGRHSLVVAYFFPPPLPEWTVSPPRDFYPLRSGGAARPPPVGGVVAGLWDFADGGTGEEQLLSPSLSIPGDWMGGTGRKILRRNSPTAPPTFTPALAVGFAPDSSVGRARSEAQRMGWVHSPPSGAGKLEGGEGGVERESKVRFRSPLLPKSWLIFFC